MASIQIQVNGSPAPVTNIVLGASVTLTNGDNAGASSWLWEFVDVPTGSAAVLATPTASSTTFTADKEGTYLVKLTINGTLTGTGIAAVLQILSGQRFPAFREKLEHSGRGWTTSVNAALELYGNEVRGGKYLVAQSGAALTVGKIVRITGNAVLGNGVHVPVVQHASASAASTLPGIGVVVDSAGGSGQAVRIKTYGMLSEFTLNTASSSIGASVYVNDSGDLSLTAGTVSQLVGYVATVNASGRVFLANFGGGGSGLTGSGTANAIAIWGGTTALTADPTQLYWDPALNRLGVNNNAPSVTLDVTGAALVTGSFQFNGPLLISGSAGTAGQIVTSAGPGVPPTWSNPALTGTGNTGSIAYWSSGTALAADINQLTWDAAQNRLGVRTGSPSFPVDINGGADTPLVTRTSGDASSVMYGSNTLNALRIQTNSATGNPILAFDTGASSPNTDDDFQKAFIIYRGDTTGSLAIGYGTNSESITMRTSGPNAGKVGIFNIDPEEALDIVGNLQFSGALMPGSLPGTVGQILQSNGPGVAPTWVTGGGGVSGTGTANHIAYWSGTSTIAADTNQLTWDPTGNNLGIGIAAPQFPLDFGSGLANTKIALYNDGSTQVGMGVQAGQFRFHSGSATINFHWGQAPNFSSDAMRLTPQGDLSVTRDLRVNSGNTFIADAVNGAVGVGNATPTLQFQVTQSGVATANRGIWATQHHNSIHGAIMGFRKSRGSVSSPTTVASNDYGAVFLGQVHDGSNYLITSGFGTYVNGTVTTGSVPTDLFFWTTGGVDNGDPFGFNLVRMIIKANGDVGFGTTTPNSNLHASGSVSMKYVTTTNASFNAGDNRFIGANTVINPISVNLPAANTVTGRVYSIKKTDNSGNAVTVTPNGGETIDGSGTYSLPALNDSVTIVSDGTNWLVFD